MPSYFLPIFPVGTTIINDRLTFENRDGFVTYFNFMTPIHRHAASDTKHFRMIISDFCVIGVCRPCEIVKAFGINERTLLRDMKLFRKEGPAGFFKTVKRGGPRVITEDIKPQIEQLLAEGNSIKDVADELNIGHEALRKAIQRGKVQYVKKKGPNNPYLN
jgi:transposase